MWCIFCFFFFFQAEDGIRDFHVTGVQTCALPVLGRALYLAGRTAQARREFAKAVQIDPVNDYAHFGLALSCARTGERTRAIAHLKLAIAMRPSDEYRQALARIGG